MLRFSISCEDRHTLQFAGEEMKRHISMAFSEVSFGEGGASIRLRSMEGDLLEDSYTVSLSSQGGEITGSNSRSVLLAVYAYLRRLGFRFLTPKDTFVPQELTEEALDQQFSRRAAYRHRGVCIEGADSLENVLDMIDWLPKLGFNGFFLQFGEPYFFLERWYTHVNNPTIPARHLPREFYQDCYHRIYGAMKQRSLLIHGAGHGFTAEALGYPSIGWIPGDREPDRNTRELMALVNGKRELSEGVPLNTNLCYSNPAAVERFCQAVVDYARGHPDVDYIHVWLADSMNRICECDLCCQELPSDQYVRLLNRLDQILTEQGISSKIVFLLYQELLYPPETERLKHPDRFVLMFAPISRTFQTSYPEKIQPMPLPPYRRNKMVLPEKLQENLGCLYQWQQCFRGDSFVYDYPLGKAHYGDFGYQHISRVIAEDIPRLKGLGLGGCISCQELRAFFPTGLPNYVMGQALLEGTVDFPSAGREYFQAAFGAHWQTAWDYLEGVSGCSSLDHFVGKGPRKDPKVASGYEEMLRFVSAMEPKLRAGLDAERKGGGKNTSMRQGFWERLLLHREYCMTLGTAMLALARGEPDAEEKYDRFCDLIREKEEWVQSYLDVYRIQEIAGKYTGFNRESVFQR